MLMLKDCQYPGSSSTTKEEISRKPAPNHITFKFQKIKDKWKIFKEAGEGKHITYREAKRINTLGFSSRNMQARREWSEIFLKC